MTVSEKDYIFGLVERARKAQRIAIGFDQEMVDRLAAAIAYKLSRPELATELAKLAYEETGMGKFESKIKKLTGKIPAVFYSVKDVKTVGVISEDKEKGLITLGKPIGVIAALVPSTNPEVTPVFKGMLGIRGRNAVIFAPHPHSKITTTRIVNIMRDILEKNGAPADLLICIEEPSRSLANELMVQCDLTMATGGKDMVHAAYSSGKPAYGVGVGNAAIIVDDTVNHDETAKKVAIGKQGDNASGCSAENSLILLDTIYDEMIVSLRKSGGYLVSPVEKGLLQKTMWPDGVHINRDIVAQPVERIAELAGIVIPVGTCFLMVEETGIGKGYPFSAEKMSLVLTLYKYSEFDEAIEMINRITRNSGIGHSCGIHSKDKDKIVRLALKTSTSRVTVCQPHGVANSGSWENWLAPSVSLGCGTWGGGIASENITQKHYINYTTIAFPVKREIPNEEEIFGDFIGKVNL